jgi:hypothetical protein
VMSVIEKSLNEYLYLSSDEYLPTMKVKDFFGKVRSVGTLGIGGHAFIAKNDNLQFIIKTPIANDENSRETIIHELFVGLCVGNKLRDYL